MSTTHKFKLPSGVEAEVTNFTGEGQRILTQSKKGETYQDRLNGFIALYTVRVGNYKNPDKDFIENMLSEDRRALIVKARQFTFDFEKVFKFSWEYESAEGYTKEEEIEIPLETGDFPITPCDKQYESYDDIDADRYRYVTLPKSGKEIRYELLTGKGEKQIAGTKKEELSSHSILEARNPCEKDKDGDWIKLNISGLDKLHLKDIEALREAMVKSGGKVETLIAFKHPEAESQNASQKIIKIDVIDQVRFFYPSGTIA